MANKTTRALDADEYRRIIEAIETGFTYTADDGKTHRFRANRQLSVILRVEATTGIRIGDVLNLRLADIVKDGKHRRLNITEQKTGKTRRFTVPDSVYAFLRDFADDVKKGKNDLLFTAGKNNDRKITERAVQKQLAIVSAYIGIDGISTHSFRKLFACYVYEKSDYDIRLVQELLQHASVSTTQRYLPVGSGKVENALVDVGDNLLIA